MIIKKCQSPNFNAGRKGFIPDIIVCHITEGGFNGAVSWLGNKASGVSAHFVVSKDGQVVQLVNIEDTAWANGTSTNSAESRYYGNSNIRAVRERKTNANYYTISIEFEGHYKDTAGALTPVQTEKAIELMAHIYAEVQSIYGKSIPFDREHIVGHCDIAPKWKPSCPGDKFPFDEIIRRLVNSQKGVPIISKPTASVNQMKKWAANKNASLLFIDLANTFYNIATQVGINPVVAYCQSAKETGFGRFGGVLDETYCNPCGMKTVEGGGDYDIAAHKRFDSWEDGINAQIDHLALYAGANGYPRADTKDPRHFKYLFGGAPTVEELGGKWASSSEYGKEITSMMKIVESTLADESPLEFDVDTAIGILVKYGVIKSPEYWKNSVELDSIEYLENLIINMASTLQNINE